MKISTHFRPYLAHLFLESEMLQIHFVEKIKTHVLCSKLFCENRAFCKIM